VRSRGHLEALVVGPTPMRICGGEVGGAGSDRVPAVRTTRRMSPRAARGSRRRALPVSPNRWPPLEVGGSAPHLERPSETGDDGWSDVR